MQFLSVAEVAERLGVSRVKVREGAARGLTPFKRDNQNRLWLDISDLTGDVFGRAEGYVDQTALMNLNFDEIEELHEDVFSRSAEIDALSSIADRHADALDSAASQMEQDAGGKARLSELLERGEVSIHDDRWLTYPWGVNGGEPRMRSIKRLVRMDGSEENIPFKCDRIAVEPGDILYFNTWGGGWGNPLERDLELMLKDVNRGLVTVDGAKRYGVVVKSGAVDRAATSKLRKTMEGKRGQRELFSRGFSSIDELKSRCLKETGFEPPATPIFRGQYAKAAE
jgi:hypothetical protein